MIPVFLPKKKEEPQLGFLYLLQQQINPGHPAIPNIGKLKIIHNLVLLVRCLEESSKHYRATKKPLLLSILLVG